MSIIIFDLSSSRDRFEKIIENLIKSKGLQFSVIDVSKIDFAYNDVVQSLTKNIIDALKNKSLNTRTIENVESKKNDSIVDNFNYFLFSEYGIDIQFETLYGLISNIETGLIEDIVSALPNVDDKMTIFNHYFVPLNSLAIEYKDDTNF